MRQVGQMETNMTNHFIFIEKDFNTKKKHIQKDMQFTSNRRSHGFFHAVENTCMFFYYMIY